MHLTIFWVWSNIVLPNLLDDEGGDFDAMNTFSRFALNIISLYFIINEIPRAIRAKLRFFYSLENLLNIGSAVLIFYNTVIN